MPLQLIRQDITQMQVDAIVNSANKHLTAGSGVNGAIHKAAGPELLKECLSLGGCQTGEAKRTAAYNLPCKYIIRTVGPVWHGGAYGEKDALAACYRSCLTLAQKMGCESIAFPLISSGVFGYPKDQALKVAVETISTFLLESDADMLVYLLIFSKEAMQTGSKLYANIQQYIDDNDADRHVDVRRESIRARRAAEAWDDEATCFMPAPCSASPVCAPLAEKEAYCEEICEFSSLDEALEQIDESFSEMVLRKIKEKGMKNADCYKKAKTSRGGLAFEQMEIYIKYHRDAENRLSIFERVKALSKSQANPYAYVKKWFLQNYPKYTETPELDAEGYLKAKTEETDAASTNETVSNEVAFPAAS